MSTIEVDLPDNVFEFAKGEAERQGYRSVDEFVAAVLTRAKEARSRVEKELADGLASGPVQPFLPSEFEDLRDQIRRKAT